MVSRLSSKTGQFLAAKVRQPLLCVGKLFRGGWHPRPSADGNAAMFMCKGSQEFPIHFSTLEELTRGLDANLEN